MLKNNQKNDSFKESTTVSSDVPSAKTFVISGAVTKCMIGQTLGGLQFYLLLDIVTGNKDGMMCSAYFIAFPVRQFGPDEAIL